MSYFMCPYGGQYKIASIEPVNAKIQYPSGTAEFGKLGIDPILVRRIIQSFSGNIEQAIEKIKENPYILYREVKGICFQKADKIAQSYGIGKMDRRRVDAVVLYILEQNEQAGNTWLFVSELQERTEQLLGCKLPFIEQFCFEKNKYGSIMKQLLCQNDLIWISEAGDKAALLSTYRCEQEIASRLTEMIRLRKTAMLSEKEIAEQIHIAERIQGFSYTEEQRQLFYKICMENVVVYTGNAGTGKTSTLAGCLRMLERIGIPFVCCSPTARAAKVLTDATGREAVTMHRLLEASPFGFKRNESAPIAAQMIIVDECSMVDIFLFRALLRAMKQGTRLLLIGDTAQLESVSAGNILDDLITSGMIPVIRLNTVFRQQESSGIIRAATSIRMGKRFFDAQNVQYVDVAPDCHLRFGGKEQTASRICQVFRSLLNQFSVDDILVLSPRKEGLSGVRAINREIQAICNPPAPNKKEWDFSGYTLREGDKVMHLKNFYEEIWLNEKLRPTGKTGIFNGDIGVISKITEENNAKAMYVDYGEGFIRYTAATVSAVNLAYCVSVHKSQGSDSKAVIVAVDFSHSVMLRRNLLYTAVTRAREQLYIVGERAALEKAIQTDSRLRKRSLLGEILMQAGVEKSHDTEENRISVSF